MDKETILRNAESQMRSLVADGLLTAEKATKMLATLKAKAANDDLDDMPDETEDDDDEAKSVHWNEDGSARKQTQKGIFKSVILGQSRVFDIDQIEGSGPRIADEGTDNDNREYSDEIMARIAGANARLQGGDPNALPNAGAGATWEGDTRSLPYRATLGFMPAGEGDNGRAGGEDGHGTNPARPNLGADGSYSLTEIGQLDGIAVRLGNQYVLSPQDPGIAPASSARFPDALTSVLKSKGMRGLFANVIRRPTSDENGKG